MGPRLFTAEGSKLSTCPSSESSLQWGRGCSPRKVVNAGQQEGTADTASMGPRLFTAEGPCSVFSTAGKRSASMGPRLFTAEGLICTPRLPGGACSFNGAAVVHRGRYG